MPPLHNPDFPWDHPAITQVTRRNAAGQTMGYSVRTERYRYTTWSDGADGEELYDYHEVPRELKNLANDSNTSDLKASLRTRVEKIASSRWDTRFRRSN